MSKRTPFLKLKLWDNWDERYIDLATEDWEAGLSTNGSITFSLGNHLLEIEVDYQPNQPTE